MDGCVVDQSQLKDRLSPPRTVKKVAEFIGQCLKGISTTPTIVEQCLYTVSHCLVYVNFIVMYTVRLSTDDTR